MKKSLSTRVFSIVLCLTMLFAVALGTGCKSEEPAAATPAERELVAAAANVPVNMDPYASYGPDAYGHYQVYSALTYLEGADRNINMDIAEKYEASEDGLTYTFYLKKGIKFSNGDEFTAEDAQFSLLMAPESEFTKQSASDIVGCDIIDDYTIALHIATPNVSILERLSNIYMMNKDFYEGCEGKYGTSVETVCGTGPYRLTAWVPGVELSFEANEDYYRGAPSVKKAKMKAIADNNTAMIALQSGEIDLYIGDVPGIALDSIRNSENITLVEYASNKLYDILLNCENGVFSDVRMRQAVAYAIDRNYMMQVGVEGEGIVVDYPGYPNYKGCPDATDVWPYTYNDENLEKARQIVKECGYENYPIAIKTYTHDNYPKLATAAQSMLNAIGFDAKVELMETNTYIEEVLYGGNYEFTVVRTYPEGSMDMYEMFNMLLEAQIPGWNWTRYVSQVQEETQPLAAAEQDYAKRQDLYEICIQDFLDNVPIIPLYMPNGSRAFNSELTCDEGNAQYERFFWYSWK